MSWNFSTARSQKGRVAIVTGANTGLGFATASGLARLGAKVVLASRSEQRLKNAAAKIRSSYPDANLVCQTLDLGDLSTVRAFAEQFSQEHDRLDLLINNAGIMMSPYQLTTDGFEHQLAVNYIGHFALTDLLLPLMNETSHNTPSGARIVTLSSLAHSWWKIQFEDLHFKRAYNARRAYGQSKLACLMFSYELARRLAGAGHKTLSVAAHPGLSNTSLFRDMPQIARFVMPLVTQTARAGALPTLYAALGEDIKSGDYCGPSGFTQYWGLPGKVTSSRASRDENRAAQLWEETQGMIEASDTDLNLS